MIPELAFVPHPEAKYDFDYEMIIGDINKMVEANPRQAQYFISHWCLESLFFLLYFVLRVPVNHPFLVDRIKEVQEDNNHTLDLWAREFYKSTIITYGLNIQHILRDPDVRIGIFSHTRSIAKAFLRRIKLTLEGNDLLKALFPDTLWASPASQAPKWSEDDGIIVKRPSVYQEATVEAWGLTDGQPTSKHFSVLNYDDIVTIDSVRTPEQIKKTDDCFKMSVNLGTDGGIQRVIGTIYHFDDQHVKLMDEGGWKVRIRPAEDPKTGEPTFLSEEKLRIKRQRLGPYVYNSQMLLNPTAKDEQKFRYEWLNWYRTLPDTLSKYLVCDPANAKKEKATGSNYTVFWLWGFDLAGNMFVLDIIRDRLTLTERWKALKNIRLKWPGILRIGYEQYGMAADIQHFEEMMQIEGTYFNIIELKGTKLTKMDRIARLIPKFEQRRVYLPERLSFINKEGEEQDLIDIFVKEEYLKYPFSRFDDMLDAASRIEDEVLEATPPIDDFEEYEEVYDLDGFFNRPEREEMTGRNPWTGY